MQQEYFDFLAPSPANHMEASPKSPKLHEIANQTHRHTQLILHVDPGHMPVLRLRQHDIEDTGGYEGTMLWLSQKDE